MEGYILIDRAFFEDRRWLAEKPFRKGDAWIDLLSLANSTDNVMEKRGIQIELKRGDVGWSIKGLADRWGWSQGKVRACLEHWQRDGQITFRTSNETTITHVNNYVNYQDGMARVSALNRDQIETKPGANRDQIETEREREREKGTEVTQGEKGVGGGATCPTLSMVMDYFTRMGSDYAPEEIKAVVLSFEATAHGGQWWVGARPVGDWRAAVESRLADRRIRAQKNSAPRPDVQTEGGRFAVPPAPGVGRVNLAEAGV